MTPRQAVLATGHAGVCRVCGCTDDHACDEGCYWIDDSLCSTCIAAQGHTVRMTREYPATAPKGLSVATCSCRKFERKVQVRNYRRMDWLIQQHWICVVAEAREKETADA